MSIIDLTQAGLDETFETTVLPKGEEAELRIINIIEGKDKNGNNFIMPFFESTEDPYCKEFGDYLPLPNANMGVKELQKAKSRLSKFFAAFDIDASRPIDLDECMGKIGWAILGLGKDQEGEEVNKISKYLVGH